MMTELEEFLLDQIQRRDEQLSILMTAVEDLQSRLGVLEKLGTTLMKLRDLQEESLVMLKKQDIILNSGTSK